MSDHRTDVLAPANPVPTERMIGRRSLPSARTTLDEIVAQPRRRPGWWRRHRAIVGSSAAVAVAVGVFAALLVSTRPADVAGPKPTPAAPAPANWGITATLKVVLGPDSTLPPGDAAKRAQEIIIARAAAAGFAGTEASVIGPDQLQVFVPSAENLIDFQLLYKPADVRIYDASTTVRARGRAIGPLVEQIPGVPSADPRSYVLGTKTTPVKIDGFAVQRIPEKLSGSLTGEPGPIPENRQALGLPKGWTIVIENGPLTSTSPGELGFALLEGDPLVAPDDIVGARAFPGGRVALKLQADAIAKLRSAGATELITVATQIPLIAHTGWIDLAAESGLAPDEVILRPPVAGDVEGPLVEAVGGGLDADFIVTAWVPTGSPPERTGRPLDAATADLLATEKDLRQDTLLEALRADTAQGRWQFVTALRRERGASVQMTLLRDGKILGRYPGCPLPANRPILNLCTSERSPGDEISMIGRTHPDAAAVQLRYPNGEVVDGWAENGWYLLVAPIGLGTPEALIVRNASGEILTELPRTDPSMLSLANVAQSPPSP